MTIDATNQSVSSQASEQSPAWEVLPKLGRDIKQAWQLSKVSVFKIVILGQVLAFAWFYASKNTNLNSGTLALVAIVAFVIIIANGLKLSLESSKAKEIQQARAQLKRSSKSRKQKAEVQDAASVVQSDISDVPLITAETPVADIYHRAPLTARQLVEIEVIEAIPITRIIHD